MKTPAGEVNKLEEVVAELDRVEQRRVLHAHAKRHDTMERRRAERASLKEGMQLVEARRTRQRAISAKPSRWAAPDVPVPAAATISALNQVRRQAAARSAAEAQRAAALARLDIAGFELARIRAAARGAAHGAGGLSVGDVRVALAANKEATTGNGNACRKRLLALFDPAA